MLGYNSNTDTLQLGIWSNIMKFKYMVIVEFTANGTITYNIFLQCIFMDLFIHLGYFLCIPLHISRQIPNVLYLKIVTSMIGLVGVSVRGPVTLRPRLDLVYCVVLRIYRTDQKLHAWSTAINEERPCMACTHGINVYPGRCQCDIWYRGPCCEGMTYCFTCSKQENIISLSQIR